MNTPPADLAVPAMLSGIRERLEYRDHLRLMYAQKKEALEIVADVHQMYRLKEDMHLLGGALAGVTREAEYERDIRALLAELDRHAAETARLRQQLAEATGALEQAHVAEFTVEMLEISVKRDTPDEFHRRARRVFNAYFEQRAAANVAGSDGAAGSAGEA